MSAIDHFREYINSPRPEPFVQRIGREALEAYDRLHSSATRMAGELASQSAALAESKSHLAAAVGAMKMIEFLARGGDGDGVRDVATKFTASMEAAAAAWELEVEARAWAEAADCCETREKDAKLAHLPRVLVEELKARRDFFLAKGAAYREKAAALREGK